MKKNQKISELYRSAASRGGAVVSRTRLSSEDREQQILDGAVQFFSERGLEGQLRDLAKSIGITHALLFHYFPTKQDLLAKMYEKVFEGRWKPEWEDLLDRSDLSTEDKLTSFYCSYAREVLTPEWVRIMIFSGLSDRYIPDRFFVLLRARLFPRLIRETRSYRAVPVKGKASARELELLMGLHGGIFYTRLRQWVYGQAVHSARNANADTRMIRDRVRAYLISAKALLEDDSPKPARRRVLAIPA